MNRYSFISANTTVAQVVEALSKLPQDAKIMAFNGDSETMESVTGLLFLEEANTVEVCTDDP